jgi:hypothetical protein
LIFDHCLKPGRAQQTLGRLGVDHPAALDLASTLSRDQCLQLGVHDDSGPIRI